MNFKISIFFSLGFFIALLSFSCAGQKDKNDQQLKGFSSIAPTETRSPPSFESENISVKTFEVKDSTSGKSLGWGYDIYVDDKLTIHQPIIPAIEGNQPFHTEEKAKKTGTFAAEKMKHLGSMPTLSIAELDSLGVTK